MFLNIQIDFITGILKTGDKQFTLTPKKSLYITFKSFNFMTSYQELHRVTPCAL